MRYLEPAETSLRLPVIGQGTWGFGEDRRRHTAEVDALREGFSLGMTLVDTAEIYGTGESERVVADAIRDCRDDIFLVTKIWPNHAEPQAMRRALEASLRRLRTDRVEACLLHWPTRSVPLPRIADGLRALRDAGLAQDVGVSNFPTPMAGEIAARLAARGDGAQSVFFHELPYSLEDRRVEKTLLPQLRAVRGVLLAYSPLGHGRLLRHTGSGAQALAQVAARRGISPAQAALAFLAQEEGVIVLAKAASAAHVRQNAESADVRLTEEDLALLRRAYPVAGRDIGILLPPYAAFFSLAFGGMRLGQNLRGRRSR